MWDLPGPGVELVSLALMGIFLTTWPPGRSRTNWFQRCIGGMGRECYLEIFNRGCFGSTWNPGFYANKIVTSWGQSSWWLWWVSTVTCALEVSRRWKCRVLRAFLRKYLMLNACCKVLTSPGRDLCNVRVFHLGMRNYLPEVCCQRELWLYRGILSFLW